MTLPQVLEDLDVGITVHDVETGEIIGVNERLTGLYGYSREELLELGVGDYSAESTTYTQREALERIRKAAEGTPQQFEWHVERANGELR